MVEAYRTPKAPKIVDDAPVMEAIEEPNLHKIPVLTHYERDAGPLYHIGRHISSKL